MLIPRVAGVNPNPPACQSQSTSLHEAIPILPGVVSILLGFCQAKQANGNNSCFVCVVIIAVLVLAPDECSSHSVRDGKIDSSVKMRGERIVSYTKSLPGMLMVKDCVLSL